MSIYYDRKKVVKSGINRSVEDYVYLVPAWNYASWYLAKNWQVGKDRSRPRPYALRYDRGGPTGGPVHANMNPINVPNGYLLGIKSSFQVQDTKNKSYSRFLDKVNSGDSADMGAFIGEMSDSVKMIAARAEQLGKGLIALKRGRPKKALDIWRENPTFKVKKVRNITVNGRFHKEIWAEMPNLPRRPPKPPRSKRRKTLSEQLLELDYGWLPLVRDIFDFSAVLNGDACPPFQIKASASCSIRYKAAVYEPYVHHFYDYTTRFTHRRGGKVTVDSPWLHLAAKMGLVNPAAVAWELVPFSFLVDQFFNLGQMISAPTDFLGVKFTDYYETDFYHLGGTYRRRWNIDTIYEYNTTENYKSIRVNRVLMGAPSLPVATWRGNPYASNPDDPDSLTRVIRKAVDHIAVLTTLWPR